MTQQTFPCSEISWEQDYEARINPLLMTSLLRASIPVLEQSDWHITKVEDGCCETLLPLNKATTNQHGTHQAALVSLSADYTGGMALATLLRGVPLAGIHHCRDDVSASLWLAGMNVRYKSPSTGHLIGICEIDPVQAEEIRKRYFRGSRVLATLQVRFYSNGELTAEAEMKYFAQPTIQLSPTTENPSRSTLFSHKLKASARMIAGLRAQRSEHPRLKTHCPLATMVAGPHGELLANHLHEILPQLKDMVLTRSQHIDELIQQVPDLKQVVLVGAGLDMRSIRHASNLPAVTFFEVDLPEMIAERERVTKLLPLEFSDRRVMLSANFKIDDLTQVIGQHPRFDASVPTVFVFEGCSMYFSAAENQRIFRELLELVQNPLSCVWSDFVNTAVVTGRTNNLHITRFLEGMESLGEAFIFGTDDPTEWLESLGYNFVESITAGEYLNENDAVLNTYSFAVAKR
ncbi:MAG: YiiD C-terminal domain-containing protein [Fuerstia sp.]|nr:YiiD C-terminal domain-containing protein [Fuerstiella sp.]